MFETAHRGFKLAEPLEVALRRFADQAYGKLNNAAAEDSGLGRTVGFGPLQLRLPAGARLHSALETGDPCAVQVSMPSGRISLSVLAAPESEALWPQMAQEITAARQADGAEVSSELGTWGEEVRARSHGELSRFVGVDGPRCLLYGVAAGPEERAAELAEALYEMVRGSVVNRGDEQLPARTALTLTPPESLSREPMAPRPPIEEDQARWSVPAQRPSQGPSQGPHGQSLRHDDAPPAQNGVEQPRSGKCKRSAMLVTPAGARKTRSRWLPGSARLSRPAWLSTSRLSRPAWLAARPGWLAQLAWANRLAVRAWQRVWRHRGMPDGVTAAIAVIILLLASATGLVIMLNFKQGSSAAAETPAEPVTALTAPVPASPGSSPGLAPLPFQPVMPMPVTPPGGAPVPAVDHDTVPEQQQSAVEQHVQQPPSDTAAHSRPASGGVATHSDGDRESSAANRGQVQDRDSDNYADHDSNSDGDRHGNQHHSTESGEGRSGQSDQSSDSEQESGSGLLDGLTGLVGHSLLGG